MPHRATEDTMPLNFDYKPVPSLKALFWGLDGRGKTHGMCGLAAMLIKLAGIEGDIACIATETWVDDWHERLSRATGKRIAPLFTKDPAEALAYIKECERAKGPDGKRAVGVMLIDCMTELESEPRRIFQRDKLGGKPMQLQHYGQVDGPYLGLVAYLRDTKLHWIATAREDDDKQAVDGNEIVIGKKAKSKMGPVARLKVHCQGSRAKDGDSNFHWHVMDTSMSEVREHRGKPPASIWTEHIQRYITDSAEKQAEQVGKSRGGASRAKGARGELELAKFLRSRRYAVMRSRQFKVGGGEEPDILAVHFAGGRPLKMECKNRKTLPAKGHVDALEQAEKAGEGIAVAVCKVARAPLGQAIVTMRLEEFLALYEGLCATSAARVAAAVENELTGGV